MSDLVGNLEDWLSHDAAQMSLKSDQTSLSGKLLRNQHEWSVGTSFIVRYFVSENGSSRMTVRHQGL